MGVFYRFQDSGLDDWKKEKNFVQLGFRPGFAIQARELTQIQSMFQFQLDAIASSVGLKSGTILDTTNVSISQGGGGSNYSVSISPSNFWIKPSLRDFGYVVASNEILQLGNIQVNPDSTTILYLIIEETQVNPNGDPYPAGGGYAKVTVDESLNDNAQGFTNSSAPGATRYAINIIDVSTRIDGEGNPPPNSVDFIKFVNGSPIYAATGLPVTF